MFKIMLLVSIVEACNVNKCHFSNKHQNDETKHIFDFGQHNTSKIMGSVLTTSSGAPVDYEDATNSLNTNLLTNAYLIDAITHLTRERIPERFTHAKGAGAFGYFETTRDISHICKAKIFSAIGKKTPIVARFSPAVIEKGGVETLPDVRGFAVKFYTEDGNWDIVGLNTPMFAIKDPVYFASLFHSQKRNPASNLFDKNSFWDFLTLRPESFFILLLLLSDRGIPDGYRHMPGYSIHTYEVYNEKGVKSCMRFHFYPEAGIKNLNFTEAAKIAGKDGDYATKDLYSAIENGEHPSWILKVQILSEEDVKKASFDIYDVTRILPQDLYPLHEVGRLVLNKNPINYFAEIEQLVFSPANLVRGILGAPDKLYELRCLAYKDAHNYRLGGNHNKIPVNCPVHQVFTYNRDGVPPVKGNGRDTQNYYPNSFSSPMPRVEKNRPSLSRICEDKPYNLDQAAEYYLKEFTTHERNRLIQNIITTLCPAASFLKERAIKIFTTINTDLGSKVAKGVKTQCP